MGGTTKGATRNMTQILSISHREGELINLLYETYPTYRSNSGLLKETGSDKGNLSNRLHRLQRKGFTRKVKLGWCLTRIGRNLAILLMYLED